MKAEVPAEPVIFMKPPSAIIHSGDNIVLPKISTQVHHEGELVVAIAGRCRDLSPAEAGKRILGYGAGLDMTLRDVQSVAKKKGLPWTIAKGFDTSAPVSEFIRAGSLPAEPDFDLVCSVNGEVRQRVRTSAMIFSIPFLISYLSSIFTLEKGDLIFTGTPEGVGLVRPGDVVEAGLEGHVRTRNPVVSG